MHLAQHPLQHAAVGLLAAGLVSFAARRAGSLSSSGAVAATLVGTAAVAAGWNWGALLVLYFLCSTLLSRVGAETKARRTASVVAKGGERDATQVLANGGLFAGGALLVQLLPANAGMTMAVAALGALAAATADTWATEIGVAADGTPRSLLTLRPVPAGTSGGVSVAGTLAMIAGAAFVAILARQLGLTQQVLAVAAGATAGAIADSLLGATLQERRWCATCERSTERQIHDCGQPTTHAGGLTWLDNDAVNFAATFVGALVAALLASR
jgi:uncharacterized protein (TIGR00297 family)